MLAEEHSSFDGIDVHFAVASEVGGQSLTCVPSPSVGSVPNADPAMWLALILKCAISELAVRVNRT